MLFDDKNAYILKDKIKEKGGKFNQEKKQWDLPFQEWLLLKRYSEKVDEERKKIWGTACKTLKYDFVRKDTKEYDQVLQLFKEMSKTHDYKINSM